MSKPRVWIVLSFVLVFAAGVVAGVFGHKWLSAKRMDGRGPGMGHGSVMDFWSKEIGLDEAQMARLREVFKANDERMRNDVQLKEMRAERSKRYEELRRQLQTEIDAVLTPAQKTKLEATLKRYAEQRRKANPPNRRDAPPSPDRGGGPERAPGRGPEPSESRNLRTDAIFPFHEYLPKGVNE
jgi:Spy/CpxP family protein refolding chaperone